ncbi:MAG: hypothetical protein ACK5EX_02475 [Novosphingobium sp.]|jgi:hypothetical protein|uniref:hypothetical protein n=1 Tax=Novosphingobium sp. TaxID=1874826 RepID=UPI00391B3596
MTTADDDDDWSAALSPGARDMLNRVNLRKHLVGLERVQRIHLGLDSEPMPFTAATLAEMIQDVADNCDEHDAFTLHAVVRALRGEDEHFALVVKQRKRGKFTSPHEWEEAHNRDQHWLHWLAGLEEQGIKTEAAVHEIAEKSGASRATIFAAIKRAEDWIETTRQIFRSIEGAREISNPRPSKSEKG